jgi:hypothetical protein
VRVDDEPRSDGSRRLSARRLDLEHVERSTAEVSRGQRLEQRRR